MCIRTSLEKQLVLRGPIASQGLSVPVFLRKPTATCDFRGVLAPCSQPSGPAHVNPGGRIFLFTEGSANVSIYYMRDYKILFLWFYFSETRVVDVLYSDPSRVIGFVAADVFIFLLCTDSPVSGRSVNVF